MIRLLYRASKLISDYLILGKIKTKEINAQVKWWDEEKLRMRLYVSQ